MYDPIQNIFPLGSQKPFIGLVCQWRVSTVDSTRMEGVAKEEG